jgi:hypothetical protein
MVSPVGSIDYMFEQLILSGTYSWATTLMGLVLVIAITFMAVKVFGSNKVQIGTYGFLAIIFLATTLATAIGLFPYYILLLLLILSVITIVLQKLIGGNG